MTGDRNHSVLFRAPISLAFGLASLIALVVGLTAPGALRYFALSPQHVTENGYVWMFLTHAVAPYSVFSLFLTTALVLWFGWYIEPALGRVRYGLLIVGAAVVSGLAYFLLVPEPARPLVGGLFIASAAGTAFLPWSVSHRAQFGAGLRIFWLFAACCIVYTLWTSPMYLSVTHVAAWCVGLGVSVGRASRQS